MDEFVHKNTAVANVLARDFLIMKVNYSGQNRNAEFLKAFPRVPAYPHYFVLESDGRFLHSQGTAELEEGKSYNEKRFLEFLAKWRPEKQPTPSAEASTVPDDAKQVLAEALAQARAKDKNLLVHLATPT